MMRKRITIRPLDSFLDTGIVTWQAPPNPTRYPIQVQRIFPDETFKLVWDSMMQWEAIHFKGFEYIDYVEVKIKYTGTLFIGRLKQFETDRKRLLWIEL
ncbi:hypothetical protein D4R42_04780 [bacterium]|nr:MAG: hypothetical protein D4R42_04780 [bacterium]